MVSEILTRIRFALRLARPATVFLDAITRQYAVRSRPDEEVRTVTWNDQEFTWKAPILKPLRHGNVEMQREIDRLPEVAELARQGRIELHIGVEAELESWGWKHSRLLNSRESLFYGIEIHRVPDPFSYGRVIAGDERLLGTAKERRERFFGSAGDRRMAEIRTAIGSNKALDAYHLRSAEKAGLDYFLTLERKLVRTIRNQCVRLGVEVVWPSELLARVR